MLFTERDSGVGEIDVITSDIAGSSSFEELPVSAVECLSEDRLRGRIVKVTYLGIDIFSVDCFAFDLECII